MWLLAVDLQKDLCSTPPAKSRFERDSSWMLIVRHQGMSCATPDPPWPFHCARSFILLLVPGTFVNWLFPVLKRGAAHITISLPQNL
ncbi:hypothetical protein BV25DRAFT_1833690 [Artomyces pyxidatus]|uniref:Uncharacterized protein n=1 Tax=Artomyces pyxidatus TaxID=48021 RepID=A0ACB8SEM3_9AGAM|nr:hypothetical protein BV25DRAFT_1833690 [Artomyces pyxidatus]